MTRVSIGLTSYDSAFLELALRREFPLPTFDTELRKAARPEGVALLPDGIRRAGSKCPSKPRPPPALPPILSPGPF